VTKSIRKLFYWKRRKLCN